MLQWCWTVLNDVERGFLRISEASRTTSTLSLHFGPYRQIHGAQGSHLREPNPTLPKSPDYRGPTRTMHGFKSIRFLMRCIYLELPGDARCGNIANKAGGFRSRGHWLPLWRKITKVSDSCRLLLPHCHWLPQLHPLHVANAYGKMRRWSEGFKPLQKLNVNKG